MSLPFEIPGWLTLKAAAIIAVVVAVVGLYFYVGYLRSTIQTLEANNATLKAAVQTQQDTIDTLQKDFKAAQTATQEYFDKYKELQKKSNDLENELYREKYGKDSIEELILKDKKDRMSKIITDASNEVLRCFEVVSGSPLKPDEKLSCQ